MDTRYSSLYLSVTGRCNLHCGHCYLLDSKRADEPTLGQIDKLLGEAARYGIREVKLTGGEPFARDDLLDIFGLLKKHGLHLNAVCTNGTLITDEHMRAMLGFDPVPFVKFSFDGIGFHDRLRGVDGLTEMTLGKISEVKAAGLRPRVNYCLNRANVEMAAESVVELDRRGVDWIRFLRFSTTERVVQSGLQDLSLLHDEYFDATLRIMREIANTDVKAEVIFVNVASMIPAANVVHVKGMRETFGSDQMCEQLVREIYVDSDGAMYPCPTLSTVMGHIGMKFENAYDDPRPFDELLRHSECADCSMHTINELVGNNDRCRSCQNSLRCRGGCRVIALAQAYVTKPLDEITYFETNPFNCHLYEVDYARRIGEAVRAENPEARVVW